MNWIWQRLQRLIGPSGTLVGRDQYGNRYYELAQAQGRPRRWIRPPGFRQNPINYDPEKVPGISKYF